MDSQIMVSDYAQMDRVLREERAYILNVIKQIKKAGCNVLLIQKSILRYQHTAPPYTCVCVQSVRRGQQTLTTSCAETETL